MSVIGSRPVHPTGAYLVLRGGESLLHALAFTLLLVYQVEVAHLTPLQLVVTGTVMEATCFLAETPTGLVADMYSRRLSVLIGTVVMGGGLVVQGGLPAFGPILLGNVVWAIGYTFVSGAAEAWITDEVGQDRVQPVFLRCQQVQLALTVVGTVVAGLLGMIDLRLPMVIAGAGLVLLAAVLAPLMPETGFPVRGQASPHLRRILAEGLAAARARGPVRSFLGIALLTGVSAEVFDRLWTARVLHAFRLPDAGPLTDPALWFTVFALAGNVIALVATAVAHRVAGRRINALHPAGLMAGLAAVQVVAVVGFALAWSLWPALVAVWLRTAAQAVAAPVQAAWLARNVSSAARATVISLTGQARAVGEVIGGPPLGVVATRTSIPVALLISSAVLSPVVGVYARLRPARTRTSSQVPR